MQPMALLNQSVECPNCHLWNPKGTMRCDCGYDFSTEGNLHGMPGFSTLTMERSKAPLYAVKAAAFLLAASVSKQFVAHGWFGGWVFFPDAWYVRPLFGAVILIWQANSLKDFVRGRTLAFAGISTLIWLWVLYEGRYHSDFRPAPWSDFDRFMKDPLYYKESSLPWYLDVDPMFLCSVLLPVTRVISFRLHWLRAMVAVPCSLVAFALATFLAWLQLGLIGVFACQATYLLCMFSPAPSFLKRMLKKHAR